MTSALDTWVESYTSTTGVYWALEDTSGTTNAADSSGNGHVLVTSGFTFGVAGIVPSDSLTCANTTSAGSTSTSYAPSLTAVTIGFVVQYGTLPSGGDYSYPIYINTGSQIQISSAGNVDVTIENGSTSGGTYQPTGLIAGHTYLLVTTWNGTAVTSYQYDLTAGTAPTPATGSLGSGTFTMGTGISVGGAATGATIYMARFFILPVSLTATQVLAGATAAGYSPPVASSQGLLLSLL